MIFIWRVLSIYVNTQQSAKVDRMFNFPVGSLWFGEVKWLRSWGEAKSQHKSRIPPISSSLSSTPKNKQMETHPWIITFQLTSHTTGNLKFPATQWKEYYLHFTDKETQAQELTFQVHWLGQCWQVNIESSFLIPRFWNSVVSYKFTAFQRRLLFPLFLLVMGRLYNSCFSPRHVKIKVKFWSSHLVFLLRWRWKRR